MSFKQMLITNKVELKYYTDPKKYIGNNRTFEFKFNPRLLKRCPYDIDVIELEKIHVFIGSELRKWMRGDFLPISAYNSNLYKYYKSEEEARWAFYDVVVKLIYDFDNYFSRNYLVIFFNPEKSKEQYLIEIKEMYEDIFQEILDQFTLFYFEISQISLLCEHDEIYPSRLNLLKDIAGSIICKSGKFVMDIPALNRMFYNRKKDAERHYNEIISSKVGLNYFVSSAKIDEPNMNNAFSYLERKGFFNVSFKYFMNIFNQGVKNKIEFIGEKKDDWKLLIQFIQGLKCLGIISQYSIQKRIFSIFQYNDRDFEEFTTQKYVNKVFNSYINDGELIKEKCDKRIVKALSFLE